MNYTKLKDRNPYNDDIKNPKSVGNTFSYPTREMSYQKSNDKNKRDLQK